MLLLGIGALSLTGRAAECSPRGKVSFICGLSGPEDLVPVPGTPWIVVSAVAGGPLQLINTRSHATVAAFPSPSAASRLDTTTYKGCPGPFEVAKGAPSTSLGARRSITHGVNVRPGRNGSHTLYVVHHGFRESIEVFEIDAKSQTPRLTWVGCILSPDGLTLNGVASLPGGGLAATVPYRKGMAEQQPAALKGADTGDVHEWHPGRGWSVVPGSSGPGPNGIEASPDGRWLYVGLWPVNKVVRLSRGTTPVDTRAVNVSFHPDNLRLQADGSLLAGGHFAPPSDADIMECMTKMCASTAARVARIDPRTMTAQEIVSYPADEVFFGGTAALQVGTEIWIGSFRGDRIARYPRQ